MNPTNFQARLVRLWHQHGHTLLIGLALVPRFVMLDSRPVFHDESLFAYYALVFSERGNYTHMPILHGPTLILLVGWVFELFGDSIAVARGFIAFCSLVALGACLALCPRHLRAWLAPLLFTSPILLYFSRFMRNEMLFSAILMLGMLAMTYGLSGRRGRSAWAVLGLAGMIALLAVKENSLFVYASGATFALVWALMRRLPGSGGTDGTLRAPAERPGSAPATAWLAGLILGGLVVALVYGATLGPRHRAEAIRAVAGDRPEVVAAALEGKDSLSFVEETRVLGRLMAKSWLNGKRSWDYWKGQHTEHRVFGALHYHVPILLTYELPLLLLIGVGLLWDAISKRSRGLIYTGAILLWGTLWLGWRALATPDPPAWLTAVQGFLHVGANGSMLALGLMLAPLFVWSLLSLRDGRVLAAWMGWWAACSLFQYSSAGEKVPWLAVHITLPLYMTLVWLWEPRLRAFGAHGRWVAAAVVLVATSISFRNDVYIVGERSADPRERLVFNHTTPWVHEWIQHRLAIWQEVEDAIPLRERTVVLGGDPAWPGIWYFRHCRYRLIGQDSPLAPEAKSADLVIATVEQTTALLEGSDGGEWVAAEGSLRDHWWAPWPDESLWWPPGGQREDSLADVLARLRSSTSALWRYYWLREPWTEPGGFPVVALEPRQRR